MTSGRYALYGAGAAARTPLSGIPCLRQELGPVSSATLKVAGRIANTLQAGRAERDLSSFQGCEVILICAPDTGLDRAVEALLEAPVEWHSKTLLFCFSGVASSDFPCFQDRGASVGSVNAIDGHDNLFVIEGERKALREAKRMVKELKGNAVEVEQDKMLLFEAARTISSSLFTPLISSCAEWLRQAGIESKEANRLTEKMLVSTLRSYLHSGRRGWTGPVARRDWTAIEKQYLAVRKVGRMEAEYFRSAAEHAFTMYESYPELAQYLLKKVEKQ